MLAVHVCMAVVGLEGATEGGITHPGDGLGGHVGPCEQLQNPNSAEQKARIEESFSHACSIDRCLPFRM